MDPFPLARSEVLPLARVLIALETLQRSPGRVANVKTSAGDRVVAMLPPAHVATDLVVQIPADGGDTVGQRQRHAGVVGPLARAEPVRSTSAIAHNRRKGTRRLKLHCRSQRVAHGQPQQSTTPPIKLLLLTHRPARLSANTDPLPPGSAGPVAASGPSGPAPHRTDRRDQSAPARKPAHPLPDHPGCNRRS